MFTTGMIVKADLVIMIGRSVEQVFLRPMLEMMNKKPIDWALEDPIGSHSPRRGESGTRLRGGLRTL